MSKYPTNSDSILPRAILKNYITYKTNEKFAGRFLQFFQFKSFINFKDFSAFGVYLKGMNVRLSNLVSFLLYDYNEDGFICQSDIFKLFSTEIGSRL